MITIAEKFIIRSKVIHKNKYSYDKVIYSNQNTKVIITCPEHGDFLQKPHSHLHGQGCPRCAYIIKGKKLALTKEEFIKKATEIHNYKYDYSLVEYKNTKTYVRIICKIHGEFNQTPSDHLKGIGCAKCARIVNGINLRLVTSEFIKKARSIHGDKYDYSNVKYINNHTKVVINCPAHGEFEQIPNSHLKGRGCKSCGGKEQLTTDQFIYKAINKHGNIYDYSKSIYINAKENIIIICKKHGNFEQKANNHLNGAGCPKCILKFIDTNEFIKRAKETHGDKYNYDKVNYINSKEKVTITCKLHGDFNQIPSDHIRGYNCSKCNYSKGEETISKILTKHKIEYIPQYKIPEAEYRYRYDFFLPKYRLLIEFHGEQHYRPIDWFGGEEAFKDLQFRDKIKKTLAKLASYRLLEIKYTYLIKLSEEVFENKLISSIVNKSSIRF